MKERIKIILRDMGKYLSATEMQILQKSLIVNLLGREKEEQITTNEDYLKMFLITPYPFLRFQHILTKISLLSKKV